jgi:glycosyltransferase involved in cell wall biosynthesis
MRILHLIPTLSGGGAERQLALLAREHAETGVASAIIYHGEGPNLEFLRGSKVDLFPLSIRNNHDPMAFWAIIRIIRRWRPDIVQTWLPQMDILGGIAARIAGVPHILSERASGPAYGADWKSRTRASIGRKAKAIIANSQTGAQYWRDLDARGSIHVVVNAITPFDTTSGTAPAALKNPAILYAGRLAPQKNLEPMIAGLALALSQNSAINAYIVGTGHQGDEVRQWIAQTAVADRIHMIGYVNNLHPWYKNADVFVSVSDFEGHPNVVLEAASVSCPLVLSDIPEHREAIPSDGALFVDGHNPEDIAEKLLSVLADPEGTALRAETSKAFVAGLSVESQAALYLKIYHNLAR